LQSRLAGASHQVLHPSTLEHLDGQLTQARRPGLIYEISEISEISEIKASLRNERPERVKPFESFRGMFRISPII
jgi:hypothetical protein